MEDYDWYDDVYFPPSDDCSEDYDEIGYLPGNFREEDRFLTRNDIPSFQSQLATMWCTIKADGVRTMIFGDQGGKCYAIDPAGKRIELGQAKAHCDFQMFAEMVSIAGKQVFLCHDVHRWQLKLDGNASTADFLTAMATFVSELGIANVVFKPWVPAVECRSLLEKSYPYATDGIIFGMPVVGSTLNKGSSNYTAEASLQSNLLPEFINEKERNMYLKWIPSEKLTVDFKVGYSCLLPDGGVSYPLYCYTHRGTYGVDTFHFDTHIQLKASTIPASLDFTRNERVPCLPGNTIVKLSYDSSHHKWRFERIRSDRLEANSLSDVELIFSLISNPISLDDIINTTHTVTSLPASTICSFNMSNLDIFHQSIKRLLFSLYSHSVHREYYTLDLNCGNTIDIDKYIASNLPKVVVIKKDVRPRSELVDGTLEEVSELTIDLALPQDLRSVLPPSSLNKIGAVFCHLAIHNFFSSNDAISTLLNNVVPILAPNAYFVVTYMDGATVRSSIPFEIRGEGNSGSLVEFSIDYSDDSTDSIDIFVRSTGETRTEAIVNKDALVESFSAYGFTCMGTFSFAELESIIPSTAYSFPDLSKEEKNVSSLCRASIFQYHQQGTTSAPSLYQRLDISIVVANILPYLDITDLVRYSGVSTSCWQSVDRLVLTENRNRYCLVLGETIPRYSLKKCFLMKLFKCSDDEFENILDDVYGVEEYDYGEYNGDYAGGYDYGSYLEDMDYGYDNEYDYTGDGNSYNS